MDSNFLIDVSSKPEMDQNQRRHSLEKLTKEELIEQCNKLLALTRKSKETKEKAVQENEKSRRELKELRDKNFDLELENEVLKRDHENKIKNEDDMLLSDLPLLRTETEEKYDDQRMSCFWRFNKLFGRRN